ncbi:MAG: TOBE domain-containing protein [Pseudomonadota bacterium]|uniref:Organosulfonate utilization protein SsuF n=1 Tax=Methylophaga aminisulfidivorans MP TaxID=1026882 RepID=F5SXM9_9GAMM|nr:MULTISPECIES: TOBE domain-containing protein [Methylophaga]EGL55226.1 organosulfonate utilization protein SsuF [Methylophaga aminisulfidivorans MP]MEC9411220.1 TOBE domain-containing protein [Pseudomonadota bacterium]WVI84099.1 TOBE domain-containing protein [Methylophaga thalassica]
MTIRAINTRNQFKGVVKRIKKGDVVSEVEIDTGIGVITSVVTTSSVEDLDLKPGEDIIALFKSTEVALAKFSRV